MVSVRSFRSADVEAYLAIQETAWDESMAAARSKLEERARIFPTGLLVVEHDGAVVGCATFIRIDDYHEELKPSWEEITDNGWCTTHVEDGRLLFGVDLSVGKGAPRLAAPMLFMAALELSMRLGVESIIWGGRMPRYHKRAHEMSPEEYLFTKTKTGRYIDPEVELYSKVPGVQIFGVIPEYFKDFESLNNGVLLRWPNPIARYPFLRPFAKPVNAVIYRTKGRRGRTKGRRSLPVSS